MDPTHGDVVDPELPTAVLTARFSEAVRWASLLHSDQCRKGTRIAYVSHLLAVASLVLEDDGDEDEAIAAVLHDTIEDQQTPQAEIRARFGGRVAAIVQACSDGRGGPRDGTDWKQRKQDYLAHLRDPELPAGTLRVAAADKLHNARSILTDLQEHGPGIWSRFHAGPEDQRWYYEEVSRVLSDRHDGVTTRELHRVVEALVAQMGNDVARAGPDDGHDGGRHGGS
jgi:(p)ppGpp synthase/HD superfamily hydrolase